MTRLFVILPEFEKQWAKMGLNDNDLKRLQSELLENPEIGAIMQGTGGLRKVRFAFENRGKSGSVRVAYVDFAIGFGDARAIIFSDPALATASGT